MIIIQSLVYNKNEFYFIQKGYNKSTPHNGFFKNHMSQKISCIKLSNADYKIIGTYRSFYSLAYLLNGYNATIINTQTTMFFMDIL